MASNTKNLISALNNNKDDIVHSILDNMLEDGHIEKIMKTFDLIQSKGDYNKVDFLHRVMNFESQNKIIGGTKYSFFCIPVISDTLSLPEMPSSEIASILSSYSMPDDNIYLFDGWVDFEDLNNMTPVEFRYLMNSILPKIKNQDGVCFLNMVDNSCFLNFPAQQGNLNNSVYMWENGQPIQNIGVRFIMGVISFNYKKGIKRNEGLFPLLLSENEEDYFLEERQKIMTDIGNILPENVDVMFPDNPLLAIDNAHMNLNAFSIKTRIEMIEKTFKKRVKPVIFIHQDEDEIFTLMIKENVNSPYILDTFSFYFSQEAFDLFFEDVLKNLAEEIYFLDDEEGENFFLNNIEVMTYH